MYNRYVRNDTGTYTRIPQEDSQQSSNRNAVHHSAPHTSHPPPHTEFPPSGSAKSCSDTPPPDCGRSPADGLTGILRHFLDQLHLNHVDTGDLLLLVLLFFLFREDADEELLVALGLLLIL